MRSIFLFGGFVGFAVVAIAGLLAGRSGDKVLLDAAIGCVAGAMLFRWFWVTLQRAVVVTVKTKRAKQRAAEEAAAAANQKTSARGAK